MATKQICVVGLDEHNRKKLEALPDAEQFTYANLLDLEQVKGADRYPVERWLSEARSRIRELDQPVDAIIGFWDFPVTTLTYILANEFSVPAPSLESLLRCDHKVLSRIVQQEAAPEHVPGFSGFDPFSDDPFAQVDIELPFWIKPLKAWGSQLGFHIESEEQFHRAVEKVREGIGRFAEPLNWFLELVDVPESVAQMDGCWCIAEEIIGGMQCTVSGYNFQGETSIYGIVDSHNFPDNPSFFRYQYPSKLPPRVQQKLVDISRRVIYHIGYEDAAFNIEFYYDEERDAIWLLEINPRMSQSHAHLYEQVEGASNHQVAIDIALGRRPRMIEREGHHELAAKLHLRVFEDGTVTRVPTEEDICAVRDEYPGTEVLVLCEEGQRLRDLADQDSYSYRLAVLYMVGEDEETMLENYNDAVRRLRFEVNGEPIERGIPS